MLVDLSGWGTVLAQWMAPPNISDRRKEIFDIYD